MKKALKKFQRLAVIINRSHKRSSVLAQKQHLHSRSSLALLQLVPTRWGSMQDMFERYNIVMSDLQEAFSHFRSLDMVPEADSDDESTLSDSTATCNIASR